MKPVVFCGSSATDLRAFPASARRSAGYQIDRVQNGLEPHDAKAMPTVGPGVQEIRFWDEAGAFRVIYLARLKEAVYVPRLKEAVYVLHCFQKKTQKTTKADLDLASRRYSELMRERKR